MVIMRCKIKEKGNGKIKTTRLSKFLLVGRWSYFCAVVDEEMKRKKTFTQTRVNFILKYGYLSYEQNGV